MQMVSQLVRNVPAREAPVSIHSRVDAAARSIGSPARVKS
jgi:hypothetical protein